MSAETWWIVGCVVVGAIGLWLVLRSRRAEVVGDPPKVMYSVKAPPPPPMPGGRMATELAPLDHYVRKLVADGNKVEAIKAVREHTGLGLKEAKDYVDAIPNVPPLSNLNAAVPRDVRPMDESGVRRAAWDLIANDRKIEAIKLIREHFGWDLKRAKDYADALQQTPASGAAHALFVDANVSELLADSPMVRRAIERAYEKGMSEADITAMFVKLTGKDPAEVGPVVASMKPSQKPIV